MQKNNHTYKWMLVISLIFIILFQASSLAISETNAEVKERYRQERLVQNLALSLEQDDDGYFLISSAANARDLSKEIEKYGTSTSTLKFRQTANIDLSEVSYFYGIGGATPFSGIYDGQGYHIKNLFVTGNNRNKGYFGTICGATITDVVVESGSIAVTAENYSAGGVIGFINEEDSANSSFVYGCVNLGCKVSATHNLANAIGGVVGFVSGNGGTTVDGCYNAATVEHKGTPTARAGGVIGYCSKAASLYEDMNTGTIKAGVTDKTTTAYAGGVVGQCYNTSMKYCVNKGSVYAYGKEQTSNGTRTKTLDYEVLENFSSSDSSVKELFLIRTDYTTISKKYKNAYAGGICAYTNKTVSCSVDMAGNISGGYCQTTIKYEFIIGKQAGYSWDSHLDDIWYGEHYVIDFTEKVNYAERIARGPNANTNNYSTGSNSFYNSSDLSFKVNATSNLYDARYLSTIKVGSNTTKGYIFDPTTGERVGSGFTNAGIKASLTEYSKSSYSNSVSGLNFIEKLTTDRSNGTWPEDYPGFGSNKVKSGMGNPAITSRYLYIDYDYYVRTYTKEWSWSQFKNVVTNTKHTRSKRFKTFDLPYKPSKASTLTKNSLQTGLSSTYFGVSSSINNGYPYLKTFYWEHNAEKPS